MSVSVADETSLVVLRMMYSQRLVVSGRPEGKRGFLIGSYSTNSDTWSHGKLIGAMAALAATRQS